MRTCGTLGELDNAANTKIAPKGVDRMLPYLSEKYHNARHTYSLGAERQKGMDHARQPTADSLGAKPEEIHFTTGGSATVNKVINATTADYASKGTHIITTKIEYHATLRTS